MPVAANIRKLGFRRWHERQLIEAHASLVTAFLCVIVIAVCLDQLHWRDPGLKPLMMLVLIAAGIALCCKTVTFYFKVLFRAEHLAAQATCGSCKVYGVIDVLAFFEQGAPELADTPRDDWLKVRCRRCGHAWTMTADQPSTPVEKSL
jgi:hypothetical protein